MRDGGRNSENKDRSAKDNRKKSGSRNAISFDKSFTSKLNFTG